MYESKQNRNTMKRRDMKWGRNKMEQNKGKLDKCSDTGRKMWVARI